MPTKLGLTACGSSSYSTICSTMLRERPGKCCLTAPYAAWKGECAATACWCDPSHDRSQIRISNEPKSASKPLRMTLTMQTADYKPAQPHAQHCLFIKFHRANYFLIIVQNCKRLQFRGALLLQPVWIIKMLQFTAAIQFKNRLDI